MKSNRILLSALRWWRRKSPAHWTQEQHLAQPTVNCVGPDEYELAEAVAEALREKDKE